MTRAAAARLSEHDLRREAFRRGCELDDAEIIGPLLRAIDAVYREAIRFYRKKCGTGYAAIDTTAFFKRRNLHKEFAKYLRGSSNKSRVKFQKAWSKFEKALRQELEG
jgi:hypothetical protein